LLLALRESKEQQHLALREGQELQQRNRSMALTIRDLISANDVLMKELSKAKMIHPVAGGVPPNRGTGQSRLRPPEGESMTSILEPGAEVITYDEIVRELLVNEEFREVCAFGPTKPL
jgi:hypothetical protein